MRLILIILLITFACLKNVRSQFQIFPFGGQYSHWGECGSFFQDSSGYETVVVNQDGECTYGQWTLIFNDEFDGSGIDRTSWRLNYPWGNTLIGTKEQEYYAEENVLVENGILKLRTLDTTVQKLAVGYEDSSNIMADGQPNFRTFDYTSGMIFSESKFGYGKYEIRCKLPKGKGFWPAFWLYGGEYWNEIDMFEFWTESDAFGNYDSTKLSSIVQMGSIYDYYQTGNSPQGCRGQWNNSGIDFSEEFHTFTLIWDNYTIEWYIDDQLRYKKYKFTNILGQPMTCNTVQAFQAYALNTTFPQEEYLNVILNLAIEKPSDVAPDNSTPFPSDFEIDYFRYYKKVPCVNSIDISDADSAILDNSIYNHIAAKSIIIGGDVELDWNESLISVARDVITLTPGFHAEFGSYFHAHINPDICPESGKSGSLDNSYNINTGELVSQLEYQEKIGGSDSSLSVAIYPIPATERINVKVKSKYNNNYSVIIHSLQGVDLLQKNIVANDIISIDLSSFVSGVYLIEIFDETNTSVLMKKIIKS